MKITIIEKRDKFANDNLTFSELSSVKGGFCYKYHEGDMPGTSVCGILAGGTNICIKKTSD